MRERQSNYRTFRFFWEIKPTESLLSVYFLVKKYIFKVLRNIFLSAFSLKSKQIRVREFQLNPDKTLTFIRVKVRDVTNETK